MIKINKAEMMYLKSKNVPNGENGISSYRKSWYLTENNRNIRLLNTYREKVTTFTSEINEKYPKKNKRQ